MTAINQKFKSLDSYLWHLEMFEKPAGGGWYAEVEPGVFELQTNRLNLDVPSTEQTRFTRAELAEKFGFAS